jgi:malate/lactate dehydrogenase
VGGARSARHQLAARFGVSAHSVKNVVIWGNHSSTLFPDHEHAYVSSAAASSSAAAAAAAGAADGKTAAAAAPAPAAAAQTPLSALPDAKEKLSSEWVQGATGFVKTVQQRGAAVIEARGLSSALSAGTCH